MKIIGLLSFLFGVTMAQGAQMNCEVTETVKRVKTSYPVAVDINEDPHGSLQTFQLKSRPEFSALIAYLRGQAVLHLYSETSDFAFTSHSDMTGTGSCYYQILLPQEDSVQIQCQVEK